MLTEVLFILMPSANYWLLTTNYQLPTSYSLLTPYDWRLPYCRLPTFLLATANFRLTPHALRLLTPYDLRLPSSD